MPPNFILYHHTNTNTHTNININKVLPKAVPRPIILVRSNAFLKIPNAKGEGLYSSTFHFKVFSSQCKAKSTGLMWPYQWPTESIALILHDLHMKCALVVQLRGYELRLAVFCSSSSHNLHINLWQKFNTP